MMRKLFSCLRSVALASLPTVLLVQSCSTDGVMSVRPDVDVGIETAAVRVPDPVSDPSPVNDEIARPAPGLQALVPSNPMLVGYPRANDPADPGLSMPAEEVACRRELKRLGVAYRDVARIRDSEACGIDWPVEVSAIGSVRMKPAATLSCEMAATFSAWTRNELVPQARWRYWSGVKTIHQGSSYSCRNIRGSRTPSQHSVGNALDIMKIELNSGKDIDVRKPGWFAFRQKAFLNGVRSDGCQYFTTVLGPGYDRDHANHFHFDIMPRRRVACR